MMDQDKTKEQLIAELEVLRGRLVVTESTESERLQTEKALRESQAVLQATIDCLPFNFFVIGCDGRYTMQNAVSKAQQRADVVGKRPKKLAQTSMTLRSG